MRNRECCALAVLAGARWRSPQSTASRKRDERRRSRASPASISIVGVWTGDEQKSFEAVLDGFSKENPNVKVTYKSTGDNTPTVLATAVAGGNPPDLASVSQPGLVKRLPEEGRAEDLDYREGRRWRRTTRPTSRRSATINGHVYGLLIKGANKSTVWYNVATFKNAGVKRAEDVGAASQGDRRR